MSSIGAETGIAGLVYTSDRSANLVLQTGGTVPALTISNTQLVTMNGTGGVNFPSGTTAQRPANPVNGTVRYNTDFQAIECYINSAWISVSPTTYTVYYLVAAGGGGGGTAQTGVNMGGGGGSGGLLIGTTTATTGITYTITVGAGGAASTNGDNSVFGSLTAIGGGAGASNVSPYDAKNGGSGGGGRPYSALQKGLGTAGQGNDGGTAGSVDAAGGGGGANAVGGNATASVGGAGGAGKASNITGASVTYSGGGGGGAYLNLTAGTGGAGGGGNGGVGNGANPTAGTNNTGGGGGGAGQYGNTVNGGAGGSGVVILSIANISYTGNVTGSPTITYSSGNTIVKFTSSGTYRA